MHLLQGRLYHSEFDQSRIADRLLVSGLSHTVPPPGFRPFRSDHPMNFAWSLGGKHPGTRQDLGLFKPKTTGESTVDHLKYIIPSIKEYTIEKKKESEKNNFIKLWSSMLNRTFTHGTCMCLACLQCLVCPTTATLSFPGTERPAGSAIRNISLFSG